MGRKRAATFVEALEKDQKRDVSAATVAQPNADEQAGEAVVLVSGNITQATEPDAALKKKKRSYANAYVRKGQGLNAIINEVMQEKNRLLDESEAALLTTNTPPQSTAPLSEASLSTDGSQPVKEDPADALFAVPPQGHIWAIPGEETKAAVQAEPPKKKRTSKAKVQTIPAVKSETLDLPQGTGVEQAPDGDLGFGFTKAGKPRKRKAPAPKALPEVNAVGETAVKTEDAASQETSNADLGFGLTKKGKPRKRAPPRAKSAPAAIKSEDELAHDGPDSLPPGVQDGPDTIPPLIGDDAQLEAQAMKAPRRRKAKKASLEDQVNMEGEAGQDGEQPKKKRRRGPDPNAFQIPGHEILEEAEKTEVAPRPVPNLGFACLNATLRAQKPPLFTNRGCIKKTFEEKGLDYISQLVLENCKSIAGLIHWNHLNGIRFYRMSSCIFPWCSEWTFDQLKDQEAIRAECEFAGKLARAYDQRVTFHPTHFVKLGCEDGPLLDRSLHELEQHSLIMDLMGYEPSPENKINIHIGGNYGDKEATIDRFAKNFKRLSPNCQKRLTIENDDRGNSYSLKELMRLHELIGVPLVFDFHHHRFCTGDLSEEEAFKLALTTWPKGIRPVVHWSESQEGRKPSAHSDFVKGPLRLYGLDDQVDVMIEAKGKELALLRLRDPTYTPSAAALALIYAE